MDDYIYALYTAQGKFLRTVIIKDTTQQCRKLLEMMSTFTSCNIKAHKSIINYDPVVSFFILK